VLSSLLIAVLSFVRIATYAALGLWISALIPFAYQVATLVGLAVLTKTKRYPIFRASQVTMWLMLPFLLQWSLGGFVLSGAVALWAFHGSAPSSPSASRTSARRPRPARLGRT
jgi:adenylate cyclase